MIPQDTQRLTDGEVLGLDTDGCVIQWDKALAAPYNSGETLSEFGLKNMTQAEAERVVAWRV